MDIAKILWDQFLANPILQGAVISVLVARLRDVFAQLDAAAKDPSQVKNVQMLVMGLSLVVSLLTAWAQGNLHNLDPKAITDFVQVIIAALGTHQLGKDVKAIASK